jgi:ATP-dependent RNA helicase DDX21
MLRPILKLLYFVTEVLSYSLTHRLLDSVPPTAISHFKQSAEKLIEEKGAVEALAAALAHISGATSVDQRSLINSQAVSKVLVLYKRT